MRHGYYYQYTIAILIPARNRRYGIKIDSLCYSWHSLKITSKFKFKYEGMVCCKPERLGIKIDDMSI